MGAHPAGVDVTDNPTSAEQGLTYCNRCARCCMESTCHLAPEDLKPIARFLGVTRKRLLKDSIELIRAEAGYVAIKPRITETGCVFLRGRDCGLQPVKPKGGREFQCWDATQPHPSRYWVTHHKLQAIGVRVEGRR